MSGTTLIREAAGRRVIDLRRYMRGAGHPVLCIGPMSTNCVEAVVRYANAVRKPIPLVASRRQVEAGQLGCGYVNHWTTEQFAAFVKDRDHGGFVPLCRDHGGPWQGAHEESLSDQIAMERAKTSFLEDVSVGFDLLHIDPSLRGGRLTDPATYEKIFELYSFVIESARITGRPIELEVGAEQQSGQFSDAQELVGFLKLITGFCDKYGYQKPLFCVVQTGALVKEMRNVGFTDGRKNASLDQKYAVETLEKTVRYLSDIAYINGVFIKEHNGDYLSDGSMALRATLTVGGVNVAPELGVFESKSLVSLCHQMDLKAELEAMLQIFFESKSWVKWLSADSSASDLHRALIAGHYCFAEPAFVEIKNRIAAAHSKRSLNLDQYLQAGLTAQLSRMTWNLEYFSGLNATIARNQDDAAGRPARGLPELQREAALSMAAESH